jgi:hypothetical protein
MKLTAGPLPPCTAGNAIGDPVQPARERASLPDRGCLAVEDKKRGLEGILGVLRIAQNVPTDPENHRTMPRNDGGERARGNQMGRMRNAIEQLAV